MTTYILGAGASRHAGYPLAGDLGTELRSWIHLNRPSDHNQRINIDRLYELYRGLHDIERIITDLDTCAPDSRASSLERPILANIRTDLRMAIRDCFDDLRKNPSPLYKQFAHERIRPGDTIVTFNYDSSCERELKQAGKWEISNGYGFSLDIPSVPPSSVEVLKLHGSSNWWALLFGGSNALQQVSNSIGDRPVIYFDPDYEFLGYGPEVRDPACARLKQVTGWPAIIMPTLDKKFYVQTSFGREWEMFWLHLWEKAKNALSMSQEIVIIGYSMTAADQRARNLLLRNSNRDANVAVYSGRASANIRDQFIAHGFQHVRTSDGGRFEEYLARESS